MAPHPLMFWKANHFERLCLLSGVSYLQRPWSKEMCTQSEIHSGVGMGADACQHSFWLHLILAQSLMLFCSALSSSGGALRKGGLVWSQKLSIGQSDPHLQSTCVIAWSSSLQPKSLDFNTNLLKNGHRYNFSCGSILEKQPLYARQELLRMHI